jgi:hypothetical protein
MSKVLKPIAVVIFVTISILGLLMAVGLPLNFIM